VGYSFLYLLNWIDTIAIQRFNDSQILSKLLSLLVSNLTMLLVQVVLLCIALLTLSGPAVVAVGAGVVEQTDIFEDHASDDRRLAPLSSFRCSQADVCFNNPGFLNGFRMYKITTIRNLSQCTSVCVPTGACLFTTCTGNIAFATLQLKHLFGWECGECQV
jgi:hypothetical protein